MSSSIQLTLEVEVKLYWLTRFMLWLLDFDDSMMWLLGWFLKDGLIRVWYRVENGEWLLWIVKPTDVWPETETGDE